MYSTITSEGLVPWWPSCARGKLLIPSVVSSCTPQPRAFAIEYTGSTLLWSPMLVSWLVVVLLPSLTASEYWRKKKNGRKSASDHHQANHKRWCIDAPPRLLTTQYVACTNKKKIWSVYLSVLSYSYGQITAQSVSIRPYRDRRSGRITAWPTLFFHTALFILFPKTYVVKYDKGWLGPTSITGWYGNINQRLTPSLLLIMTALIID